MKKISPKKDPSKKNPFIFGSYPNIKKPTTDYGALIIKALRKKK